MFKPQSIPYEKKKWHYDYYFIIQEGGANIGQIVKCKIKIKEYPIVHYDNLGISFYKIGGEGVHAYISMEYADRQALLHDVITEWEIPIGAKYWIGDCRGCLGEIAANEMKFLRVVKENK